LFHLATDGEANRVGNTVGRSVREEASEDGTAARFLVYQVVSEDDIVDRSRLCEKATANETVARVPARGEENGEYIAAPHLICWKVNERVTVARSVVREGR